MYVTPAGFCMVFYILLICWFYPTVYVEYLGSFTSKIHHQQKYNFPFSKLDVLSICPGQDLQNFVKWGVGHGHPCFVLDFSKTFNVSLLSMMLAISLSYMACIMLRYIPSLSNFLRTFIMKMYLILSNDFLASI